MCIEGHRRRAVGVIEEEDTVTTMSGAIEGTGGAIDLRIPVKIEAVIVTTNLAVVVVVMSLDGMIVTMNRVAVLVTINRAGTIATSRNVDVVIMTEMIEDQTMKETIAKKKGVHWIIQKTVRQGQEKRTRGLKNEKNKSRLINFFTLSKPDWKRNLSSGLLSLYSLILIKFVASTVEYIRVRACIIFEGVR